MTTKLALRPRTNGESSSTTPRPPPRDEDKDDSQRPRVLAEHELTLEVVNAPGPEHAKLRELQDTVVQGTIFS